jgi:pyruvate dehydrogenase E2 component (dihydrolipoamide acetyltransferase)
MSVVADFVVPPVGEPIDSARLVRWLVAPGQAFRVGDVMVEIETDKSIVEVPASQDGVMVEHLVGVDGLLNADTPIARIQIEGNLAASAKRLVSSLPGTPEKSSTPADRESESPTSVISSAVLEGKSGLGLTDRKFATPAARKLARERDVSIDSIIGTGPNGRITQSDVDRTSEKTGTSVSASAIAGTGTHELTVPTTYGDVGVTVWDPATTRDARTLFLIHGLFGDRNVWAGTADLLVRAGFRALAIDLPCHGSTRSEATAVGDVVECVVEVVSNQCSGAVVLVGHSFGAAVAARVARKPALSIHALVLIAPVGIGSQIDQTFLDGMAYAESNEAMLRELRKLTVAAMTPSISYVNELRQRIAARRNQIIHFCRQVSSNGSQQIDTLPDLAALQRKTVVIQGRRDRIVPWEQALNVPARVALHLLPDAGHMPQWEATTATTDIVLDSLGR